MGVTDENSIEDQYCLSARLCLFPVSLRGSMSGTADRGNLLDDFEHSTDSGGRAYSQAGWCGSAQSEKPRFLFSCMLMAGL